MAIFLKNDFKKMHIGLEGDILFSSEYWSFISMNVCTEWLAGDVSYDRLLLIFFDNDATGV